MNPNITENLAEHLMIRTQSRGTCCGVPLSLSTNESEILGFPDQFLLELNSELRAFHATSTDISNKAHSRIDKLVVFT